MEPAIQLSVSLLREKAVHTAKRLKASNNWISNFKLTKLLNSGGMDKGTVTQNY
jgi:hypothetical protein